jgi:hypothetical protein
VGTDHPVRCSLIFHARESSSVEINIREKLAILDLAEADERFIRARELVN